MDRLCNVNILHSTNKLICEITGAGGGGYGGSLLKSFPRYKTENRISLQDHKSFVKDDECIEKEV